MSTSFPRTTTVKQEFEALFPRLLHFGVAYADARRVSDAATDWLQWSALLAQVAREYNVEGEEAWLRGRKTTASCAWHRATSYFHFAQLRVLHGPSKEVLLHDAREAFARLAPLLDPPAVRVDVPFGSGMLPGYMRIAARGAPVVILIGGLDSSKEVELSTFGETFLARGLSVYFFDGPGQGENCGRLAMAPTFETAVSAVIDRLRALREVDGDRIGVFGVSFGGYLACRAAAADRRLGACVSLGGFFDLRIFTKLSPVATSTLRRSFAVHGDELDEAVGGLSLESLRGSMDRPLLIVHGRADKLVDEGQARAMEAWATGPTELWLIDGADHVCTNKFGMCLSRIGDWMADQLAARASADISNRLCASSISA